MKIFVILRVQGQEGGQEEGLGPREAQGASVVREHPEEPPEPALELEPVLSLCVIVNSL